MGGEGLVPVSGGRGGCDQESPGRAKDLGPGKLARLMPGLSCARVFNGLLVAQCLKQFTRGANCS